MGIRIHKILGYVLTDLKLDAKKENVIDSRINLDCPFMKNEPAIGSVDGFLKFMKREEDPKSMTSGHSFLEIQMKNNPDTVAKNVGNCISLDTEMGIPSLICITPPSEYYNWRHYDDIVDYMLAHYDSPDGAIENSVKLLDKGIWPWEGYINKTNGNRVDHSSHFVYNRLIDGLRKGAYDPKEKIKVKGSLDKISKKMGFKGYKDAEKCLTPVVPDEVVLLCMYLDLFKDPLTAYSLKPAIYTYWS